MTARGRNSGGGQATDSGSGGLARAITNSVKLQHMLKAEVVKTTDAAFFKLRYAKQRFGNIADTCACLIKNVNPLMRMLTMLGTDWAKAVLECFNPSSLLLLALTAEFAAAAMQFIRA